jgi:hypothetical protein
MAVRAEHLALLELGQDPFSGPAASYCVSERDFFCRRIFVMKLKAGRMGLSATLADEPLFELVEPTAKAVAPSAFDCGLSSPLFVGEQMLPLVIAGPR